MSRIIEEVLRVPGAGEPLVEQAREVDHGADRPIALNDVLCLPSGVARDENNAAERLVVAVSRLDGRFE
jgi:hypothetical protein